MLQMHGGGVIPRLRVIFVGHMCLRVHWRAVGAPTFNRGTRAFRPPFLRRYACRPAVWNLTGP